MLEDLGWLPYSIVGLTVGSRPSLKSHGVSSLFTLMGLWQDTSSALKKFHPAAN